MSIENKEELFHAYVKSSGNVLANRILDEIHQCKQEDKWQKQSSEKERNQCIDNSLIDPGIVKKYAYIKVVHQYAYPVPYKHCWFTKSQLDLYENLSKDYKHPTDYGANVKTDEGNKKTHTLTKFDDKFKLELINELKLKQFSNDQINTASQKANSSIINKIKNKVTYSTKVRNKDEDKQSLVDVKVHQIVPSKPKAPPPPPLTVKIKTTPLTSPVAEARTQNETVDASEKADQTSDAKVSTKAQKNTHKPKKMHAPPPPIVHKSKPKEAPQPVAAIPPQEADDLITIDVTPVTENTSEYSVATTTNLDSPTKSFCSIDDIPKSGFDFLDNW